MQWHGSIDAMSVCQSVSQSTTSVQIETSVRWTAKICCTDTDGPQRMSPVTLWYFLPFSLTPWNISTSTGLIGTKPCTDVHSCLENYWMDCHEILYRYSCPPQGDGWIMLVTVNTIIYFIFNTLVYEPAKLRTSSSASAALCFCAN